MLFARRGFGVHGFRVEIGFTVGDVVDSKAPVDVVSVSQRECVLANGNESARSSTSSEHSFSASEHHTTASDDGDVHLVNRKTLSRGLITTNGTCGSRQKENFGVSALSSDLPRSSKWNFRCRTHFRRVSSVQSALLFAGTAQWGNHFESFLRK